MKFFNFLLAFLFFGLFSCNPSNNQQDGNADKSESEESASSIDPNGPDVEINVISFDIEARETKIEIINRLNEPITSISGRLHFYDADGAEMTTATGRDLSSPFQTTANPSVVESMASTEKKLGNKIPEGTVSIEVKEISGKTASGAF